MTSKNKNDHIEPEKDQETASSAETKESSNNTSNASESPSTSSDKKSEPTASTDTAKQEKNAKRGVKLGAVAIVISLIVGGGLTLQMQQQNAQYQSQIEALKKQLEQTTASVQQDLTATQQATLAKATEITHKTDCLLYTSPSPRDY